MPGKSVNELFHLINNIYFAIFFQLKNCIERFQTLIVTIKDKSVKQKLKDANNIFVVVL